MFREDSSQLFYLCRGMLAGDGEAEVTGGRSTGILDVGRVNSGPEKLAAQRRWVGRGEGNDGCESLRGRVVQVFPKQVDVFEKLRARPIVAKFERG